VTVVVVTVVVVTVVAVLVDAVVTVVVVVVLSVLVVVVVVQGSPHRSGQVCAMDSKLQNPLVNCLHDGGSRHSSLMVVVVVVVAVMVAVAVVGKVDVRVRVVVMHDLHIPLHCWRTALPRVGSEHVSNVNRPVSQSFGSGTPLHEYFACNPHVVVVPVRVVEVLGVVVDVVVGPMMPPFAVVPFA